MCWQQRLIKFIRLLKVDKAYQCKIADVETCAETGRIIIVLQFQHRAYFKKYLLSDLLEENEIIKQLSPQNIRHLLRLSLYKRDQNKFAIYAKVFPEGVDYPFFIIKNNATREYVKMSVEDIANNKKILYGFSKADIIGITTAHDCVRALQERSAMQKAKRDNIVLLKTGS